MVRFTEYAKTEVLVVSLGLAGDIVLAVAVGVFLSVPIGILIAAVSIPVSVFLLTFFRDPVRRADHQKIAANQMLAPADGKITDIVDVDDPRVGGPAVKIGIFLSVFNVHINRSPCEAKVLDITYKSGKFLNALRSASAEQNESNTLVLEPAGDGLGGMPQRIVVRQIAGVLARRIVCAAAVDDVLQSGERFGMIKFGSRTELIVPKQDNLTVAVTIGQKVKAGSDVLVEWKQVDS